MAQITSAEILHYMAKERNGISPSLFRDKHGIPIKNMASPFREAYVKGYLKQIKSPAGSSKLAAYYMATAKGEKHLKDNKAEVRPMAQIIKEVDAAPKRARKGDAPVVPMNRKANQAIDSIAQLMDDYQHANQMLKQIHQMISDYLAANQGEQNSEQKP